MTVAEKLARVAENTERVFHAGREAERDAFWEIYQQNGNRNDYTNAFSGPGWTDETYRAKYPLRLYAGWSATNIYQNSLITDTLVDIICEGAVVMNSSFYNSKLKRIGTITLPEQGTVFQSTFYGCADLEDLRFNGNITRDIDLQYSTKLSRGSIENVINNVKGGYLDHGTAPFVTLSRQAVLAAYGTLEAFEDFLLNDWYPYDPSNVLLM